jgi:environmental stress-induced protein Ves
MSDAVHVAELASVAPQPWRNGGGVTRELLAWPPGSGADWLLRVSVAEIERDGPFSPFPGVLRCFTVLEGAGVVLGLADGQRVLTRDSLPVEFDGASAPGCRLIEGPTRDLNLMARQAGGHPSLRPALAGDTAPTEVEWWGLYAASAALLSSRSGARELAPHSLAWADSPRPAWRIGASGEAPLRAWWLTLTRPR